MTIRHRDKITKSHRERVMKVFLQQDLHDIYDELQLQYPDIDDNARRYLLSAWDDNIKRLVMGIIDRNI